MSLPARLTVRGVLALHALLASGGAVLMALLLVWPNLHGVAVGQRAAAAAEIARMLAAAIEASCPGTADRAACEAAILAAATAPRITAHAGDPGEPVAAGWVRGAAPLAGAPARSVLVEMDAGPAHEHAARTSRLATGLALVGGLALFLVLYAVLVRLVARPADRLLAGLERVGSGEPALDGEAAPALGQVGAAFERMEVRLAAERRRVAEQVEELREVNRKLSAARDTVVRQEKLASVGRLSAGVAHEVGNPLAAILGYVEVLRARAGADAAVREYVDRLERETRRIDRIVRDLLDFARPSRGPSGAPVSVHHVVERTVRLVETQRRFAGVRVSTDGVGEDLPAVAADEHYLQQVLLNLLVNAADAMDGKGVVSVSAQLAESAAPARRSGDVPGARVAIEVRDEGPGIPDADLPRIFDPFFTTKQPGEGTGLGLSICHSLVESFGGAISARNVSGGGAVFRIELPAAPAASASMPGGNPWPSAAS